MDTSEKVNVFSSLAELTKEIIRDRETHDMLAQRYAVRFIMLNNFNEFKELAKFMANIGVETLDLETLMEDPDEWITNDELKEAIKACKVSTFVTPFSEVVRFYNLSVVLRVEYAALPEYEIYRKADRHGKSAVADYFKDRKSALVKSEKSLDDIKSGNGKNKCKSYVFKNEFFEIIHFKNLCNTCLLLPLFLRRFFQQKYPMTMTL